MLTDPAGDPRPVIIPQLMFCGPAQNRAAEALDHYLAVFDDATPGQRVTYGDMGHVPEGGPVEAGSIVFADARLRGEWVAAMDSAVAQDFTFTEGVSLMVASMSRSGQHDLPRPAEIGARPVAGGGARHRVELRSAGRSRPVEAVHRR